MKIAKLKKFSLAYAMVLCCQPLLGMENQHPFPVSNSTNRNMPQLYNQNQQPQIQQQPQFPGNLQHNTINWMNTAPQNEVLNHPTQYAMTPQGLRAIYQVTYQYVYPVQQPQQYIPMPVFQNQQTPMPLGAFSGNHFIGQEDNSLVIETNNSPRGFKRVLENYNEAKSFDYYTLFLLVSLHLSFEDQVTRLGAACIDWRNIIISQITEIPEKKLDSVLENDTYLKAFTNLTSLNLAGNDSITDESLSCLTNLKRLFLGDTIITDNSVKYLVNLEILCTYNEGLLITSHSLRYLTNLTSLRIQISGELFGPVLETLPKLSTLHLEVGSFMTPKDLYGMTNLTQLTLSLDDVTYGLCDMEFKSRLFKHLPKLQLLEEIDVYGHKTTESRDQNEQKVALRKKFLDEVKKDNPYSSWINIHYTVDELVKEHLENNG